MGAHLPHQVQVRERMIGKRVLKYQSWARVPAGPLRDACPRSFISSSRSAFPRAFSKLFFRVLRFAFPRSKFCNVFQFRVLKKKNSRDKLIPPHTHTPGNEMTASGAHSPVLVGRLGGGGLTLFPALQLAVK